MPKLSRSAADGLSSYQGRSACDYMLRHLNERLLLEDVARHCQLSSTRFSRKFKNSFGVSCRTWILEQRIIMAMRMFHSGRNDISQVATDCGFFDQSHFHRVFKKMVGTSPGAWLRATAIRMDSYKN